MEATADIGLSERQGGSAQSEGALLEEAAYLGGRRHQSFSAEGVEAPCAQVARKALYSAVRDQAIAAATQVTTDVIALPPPSEPRRSIVNGESLYGTCAA